jgi:hypothetical protein
MGCHDLTIGEDLQPVTIATGFVSVFRWTALEIPMNISILKGAYLMHQSISSLYDRTREGKVRITQH